MSLFSQAHGGVQARVRPSGKKIHLAWAPSWTGMDITRQVSVEPPPQCQLSQGGFFHYLALSPRVRRES